MSARIEAKKGKWKDVSALCYGLLSKPFNKWEDSLQRQAHVGLKWCDTTLRAQNDESRSWRADVLSSSAARNLLRERVDTLAPLIKFEHDSENVLGVNLSLVDEVAIAVASHPEWNLIYLEGYASSREGKGNQSRQELVQKRLYNVVELLENAGLSSARLVTVACKEQTKRLGEVRFVKESERKKSRCEQRNR